MYISTTKNSFHSCGCCEKKTTVIMPVEDWVHRVVNEGSDSDESLNVMRGMIAIIVKHLDNKELVQELISEFGRYEDTIDEEQ